MVTEYIQTQRKHHSTKTFQDELLAFLKKYKVIMTTIFLGNENKIIDFAFQAEYNNIHDKPIDGLHHA